jgi:hypothetical protein
VKTLPLSFKNLTIAEYFSGISLFPYGLYLHLLIFIYCNLLRSVLHLREFFFTLISLIESILLHKIGWRLWTGFAWLIIESSGGLS